MSSPMPGKGFISNLRRLLQYWLMSALGPRRVKANERPPYPLLVKQALIYELLKMHRGRGPGLAGCREKSGKSTELTVDLGFMSWEEITKLGKEGPRGGLPGSEAGRLLCSGNGKRFCVVGLQHALGTMQERSLGSGAQGSGL